MKEAIYTEMLVHVPICTHKEPKNILFIGGDAAALESEAAKYGTIDAKTINDDVEALRDIDRNSYDIVIAEAPCDTVALAHIARIVKEDGLIAVGRIDLDDEEETRALLGELTKSFKIAMPYTTRCEAVALLASKEYHPTADINLQRADLTDGFTVYNSDLHVGAFAMPTYIKKRYLGIIKN